MRKFLQKFLPSHDAIRGNRWLRPFENSLLHPRLWHLNRESAAGAVAAGLFCGLIPGPFQMLGAAVCALLFRVNLPLAMLTTLYTNPFTLVPLYWLAYELGRLVTGADTGFVPPPEFDADRFREWFVAVMQWVAVLGRPLVIGLFLLACALALAGYFLVKAAWRIHLIRAWRQRRRRRRTD